MNRFSTFLWCVFLLAGTALPAFGVTKSERVERYLGSYRYENARPLGTVKFIFEKAILKRRGDGRTTYKDLLFGERLYTNEDNAGHLIGIQLLHRGRTETVLPESPDRAVGVAAPDPSPSRGNPRAEPEVNIRPAPVRTYNNANNRLPAVSMPDSTTIAASLNDTRSSIAEWKEAMMESARPIWSFVMWVFNSVLIFLLCLGGLFRYIAQTAASESAVNIYGRIVVGRWIASIHQNAAAMLLVITWLIAIILLLDVFMWLLYRDMPLWLMVVIWFPILWIAEKLTNWIVPNIRVVGSGR